MFEFKILKKNKNSRTGIFHTPHGKLETPELAFVATEGEIKCIPKEILPKLPIQYLIVNTFHIWVKHILDKVGKKNGIHNYMNYKNIAASDSGGFQVFSMGFGKTHNVGKIGGMFPGKNYKTNDSNNPLIITEEGVEFQFNGQKILLTPEKSIEIKQKIGADIMFAFDECTSP
ncbi:tRNA-guanine transglycosylase, partial [Candidatus Roizmanbacteria bacterium]|nr:tRNA-guanine transglycosylase [Candidatus Roizmanbacteria bacterium]